VEPFDLGLAAIAAIAVALTYSWVVLPRLERRMETGALDGFTAMVIGAWLHTFHRPRWIGFDQARAAAAAGGAIVVSNHASGIDPFLLQLPFRRRIRWMMSRDQMLTGLSEVWEHLEVLPVTYGPADAASFREALRHVQGGGLLGLFPEAGIARPPREIRPFLAGASLLVARSRVPVIVCWIENAPYAASALRTLFKPARVTVHCLGVMDFERERDTEVITNRLRGMIQEASGWPLNDAPLQGRGRPERPAVRIER